MALFSKSPETKITADLRAATDKRDDVAGRLLDAKGVLSDRAVAVERLARDGAPDKDLDAALAARRVASDKVGALGLALEVASAAVAALETEAAAIADQKQRQQTAKEIQQIAADLAAAGRLFQDGAAALAQASGRAGSVCIDAQQLYHFSEKAAAEVGPAITMVTEVLRGQAAATIQGSARATLPRPEAPAPRLAIVEALPRMTVFAVRDLKYVDASGAAVYCGKNKKHDMPQALAELALSTSVALPLSDKRIRDLEYQATPYVPDPAACAWLGNPPTKAAAPKSGVDPILSSYFEPSPYGQRPTQVVRVPAAPAEARTGTRSQPEE